MSHPVQQSAPLRVVRALMQGVPDPALLLDQSLELISVNDAMRQRLGMQGSEPDVGLSATGLFDRLRVDANAVVDRGARCVKTGQADRLSSARTPAGDPTHALELTLLPVPAEPPEGGLLVLVREHDAEAEVSGSSWRHRLARERAKAEELARRLDQQTAELTQAMEQLARLSRTDVLTGLLNRKAFSELASETLKLAQRHRRTAAILLCDIDGLKAINERRGYVAADALLGAVAEVLSAGLRSSDVVARTGTGGGEFAILLAETTLDGVSQAATRCCRAVRELPVAKIMPGETELVTISVGVATFPQDGDTVEALLSRAAGALQHAKANERGTVAVAAAGPSTGLGRPGEGGGDRPAVLLVDTDAEQASAVSEALATRFGVVIAESAERALATLNYRRFDAVVACRDVGGEDGQWLLQKALALSPTTARLLVVQDESDFLRLVASDGARVHCFIAREDYPGRLGDVLQETLLRRRVGGTRLLSAVQPATAIGGVQTEALEQILTEEALDFVFQPIVRATHRQVVGYEALCRPQHPSLRSPVALFEAALQVGVLWEVGRLARRKLASCLAQLPPDALVFVNLHPAEVSDHQLLEGEPSLRRFSARVVFEIPLRSTLPNPGRFREQVGVLRGHGYSLALDELGSGYGRLSSLSLLEPRFLKLGGALTAELEHSENARQLLERLLDATRSLPVELVCERLETPGQVRVATRAGVHLLQGYALGKPDSLR